MDSLNKFSEGAVPPSTKTTVTQLSLRGQKTHQPGLGRQPQIHCRLHPFAQATLLLAHLLPFSADCDRGAPRSVPEGRTLLSRPGEAFASRAHAGSSSSNPKFILYYLEGVVVGRKHQQAFAKRREHGAEIR